MEAVDDSVQPPLAILRNSVLRTSNIHQSYNDAVTAKDNLQKTLSFHSQYQKILTEIKPFLAALENELNENDQTSDPEKHLANLKVRSLDENVLQNRINI